MLRLALKSDIPLIAEACRSYYDEISWGPLRGLYHEPHIYKTFAPCNGPDSVLVISDAAGEITGVFFALIMRSTLYQDIVSIAQEIVWHTSPKLSAYKRIILMSDLINFAEFEMKAKGAEIAAIGTRLAAGAAGKLLSGKGYLATGLNWQKELI